MRRTLIALAVTAAALAALAVAAQGATTLRVTADPKNGLKFDKKTLVAKSGPVTIVMPNPSILPHNVAIKGDGIKPKLGKVVLKGGTSRVSAVLRRGTYRFYCSVAGHEAGGMWGTLRIT